MLLVQLPVHTGLKHASSRADASLSVRTLTHSIRPQQLSTPCWPRATPCSSRRSTAPPSTSTRRCVRHRLSGAPTTSPPQALPPTHPHSPPAFQHRAPRRQAVRRDARDGRALLHRSIAHCKLGRFEGESQPAAPAASRGRASPAVGVLRAPADAVADADAALRLDGGSAQAHYRRGCD